MNSSSSLPSKLGTLLRAPFPQSISYWHYIKWAVAWGGYTFLIIYELQPLALKTYTYPGSELLWVAFTYALCVMTTNFGVNLATILICDKWGIKIEEDWTVLHQVVISLVHIMTIFAMVFIVGEVTDSVFHRPEIGRNEFYPFLGKLCLIGVGIYFAVEYYTRVKFYRKEATQFNDWAAQPVSQTYQTTEVSKEVVFQAEDDKVILRLSRAQIYLIEAEANYIMVFWKEKNEKLEKALLRMPIGTAEKVLENYPEFFRCHRSFIINLDEIRKIEGNQITGNSRGLQVKLSLLDREVPVARNRIEMFKVKVGGLIPANQRELKSIPEMI
jgi:hypothetical protein